MRDKEIDDRMSKISLRMMLMAERFPWNGIFDEKGARIIEMCRRQDTQTGASLLFTLDYGCHSSGWWKNPDYERCFHLSIASLSMFFERDPRTARFAGQFPELTKKIREKWARAFFRDTVRLLWIEPPFTKDEKSFDVWHYRLFVDNETGVTLIPRGEVYTREFTEAGWKSWSEIHEPRVMPAESPGSTPGLLPDSCFAVRSPYGGHGRKEDEIGDSDKLITGGCDADTDRSG